MTIKKQIANYSKNEIIYPSEIAKKYKLDMLKTYKILEDLSESGELKTVLAVYCPYCQKQQSGIYETLFQIQTQNLYCRYCKKEIKNPLKNTFVLFKRV